jgi:MoxR-like ATPase
MDPQSIDWKRVQRTGKALQQLVSELNDIFPERSGLITQMLFAMLTREHVIAFGLYGTGKTDLMNTFFGAIDGSTKMPVQFSKFMNESGILGLPDVKVMQEEGVIKFRRDGVNIFDTHFLDLDEFLDAPEPLQRTLLGILNERMFKRGRQIEACNLHSAIASTNRDPGEELRKNPQLGAVIDRFLFHYQVSYLQTPESRRKMYQKYLSGSTPTVKIDYKDLLYVSQIVLDANQITQPLIIETYDQVMEAFCQGLRKGAIVSDRRKCKLLQLLEATALLYGRYEVHPEDILSVKWGLCRADDQDELARFEQCAKPFIEEAKKQLAVNVDQMQIDLLQKIGNEVVALKSRQLVAETELVAAARQLATLRKQVEKLSPQLASTRDMQIKLLSDISGFDADLNKTIRGGN